MKKKLVIIIAVLVVCFICGFIVYTQYYMHNLSVYGWAGVANYSESPDGQHKLIIRTYRTDLDSDTISIRGILFPSNSVPGTSGKLIFWQKVDTDSLDDMDDPTVNHGDKLVTIFWQRIDSIYPDHINEDLVPLKKVDIKWIDNTTVEINGIVVDIVKGYDFRRN